MNHLHWYEWFGCAAMALTGLGCLAFSLRELWLQTRDTTFYR